MILSVDGRRINAFTQVASEGRVITLQNSIRKLAFSHILQR